MKNKVKVVKAVVVVVVKTIVVVEEGKARKSKLTQTGRKIMIKMH